MSDLERNIPSYLGVIEQEDLEIIRSLGSFCCFVQNPSLGCLVVTKRPSQGQILCETAKLPYLGPMMAGTRKPSPGH